MKTGLGVAPLRTTTDQIATKASPRAKLGGARETELRELNRRKFRGHDPRARRGEDELSNGFVTTFSVFRVVFQIVGHFTVGGATFNDNRLLNAALAPIWPPQSDALDWPRRRLAFGDDALAQLAASVSG
jgi:hypothetical protein